MIRPALANVPPAVNVLTCDEFLRFKREKMGDKLTQNSSNDIVTDIFKKDIECDGQWKAPDNADTYNSMINALHMAFKGHRGTYNDPCSECCTLPAGNRIAGVACMLESLILYEKATPHTTKSCRTR